MSPYVESPGVQSLVRGLAVIRTFNAHRQQQTLSEVAQATGLARATARRFLHTLVAEGYASTDGNHFRLTPKILELGYAYMSSLGLPTIAQPHLQELARQVGESSSLSVLEGADIVYVARVPVRRIMAINITIGTRFPAWATSMGRVLLSGLPPEELDAHLAAINITPITQNTVRTEATLRKEIAAVSRQGWCLLDQELEAGLRSLAAPVFNPDGTMAAAINISTQAAVRSLEELHEVFVPAVTETARKISTDLSSAANAL